MKKLILILALLQLTTATIAQMQQHKRWWENTFATDSPMVHDPVMAYQNGIYYLYSTGMGIQIMTSKDRKKWTFHPQPLIKNIPEWTHHAVQGFNDNIWAPDIIQYRNRYWLTYACSTFGKNTSAIGVMSNLTLDFNDSVKYKWKDCGMVIQSISEKNNWNAIDPNIVIDNDNIPWMDFGSFWEGIKLIKLDSTMHVTSPLKMYTIATRHSSSISEKPGSNAIEAPFIFKHDGYFYLFVSFDYCCRGIKSNYKIAVGRSKNIIGPYIDKNGKLMNNGGGTIILEGDQKEWAAAGHCGVYRFGKKDILICHGYSIPKRGMPILIQRNIIWTNDGWPIIKE